MKIFYQFAARQTAWMLAKSFWKSIFRQWFSFQYENDYYYNNPSIKLNNTIRNSYSMEGSDVHDIMVRGLR